MKIFILLALFSTAVFAQQKGTFTDPRDGKKYKTVKIGVQTWMAEDLKYAPRGECYDDVIDYCKKYGRLYIWQIALNACPNGWHLPSGDEWDILVDYVGGIKTAGKKLKAKTGWSNNGNGTDDFGFSALPGGGVDSDLIFYGTGNAGFWWSATESKYSEYESNYYACYRAIVLADEVYRFERGLKTRFFSVRCVRD
jgi:uncharacterized protein (TIGR02145 family)